MNTSATGSIIPIVNQTNKSILAGHLNQFSQLVITKSIDTLEHLILIILVYGFVCLSVYNLLFKRAINGWVMNSVRFPVKRNQRVLLVTAHPDDECMFFGPTILSLTRRKDCIFYLLCLSNGNYEDKGSERRDELWTSCERLRIKSENIILLNATKLQDGPNRWPEHLIAKHISNHLNQLDIDILITFDRDGVSQHPNHKSIYYATAALCLAGQIPANCKIFILDSINVIRKYVFIFDLLISFLLSNNWFILNWTDFKRCKYAMQAHQSQLLWFRRIYINCSRYMIINSLQEINQSDIELEMDLDDF